MLKYYSKKSQEAWEIFAPIKFDFAVEEASIEKSYNP